MISKEIQAKIDAAAQQYESATEHVGLGPGIFKDGVSFAMAYAKVAEAERAQSLVDALEKIMTTCWQNYQAHSIAKEAIEQWGGKDAAESPSPVNALRQITGCPKELAEKAVEFSNDQSEQLAYVRANGIKF